MGGGYTICPKKFPTVIPQGYNVRMCPTGYTCGYIRDRLEAVSFRARVQCPNVCPTGYTCGYIRDRIRGRQKNNNF